MTDECRNKSGVSFYVRETKKCAERNEEPGWQGMPWTSATTNMKAIARTRYTSTNARQGPNLLKNGNDESKTIYMALLRSDWTSKGGLPILEGKRAGPSTKDDHSNPCSDITIFLCILVHVHVRQDESFRKDYDQVRIGDFRRALHSAVVLCLFCNAYLSLKIYERAAFI